MYPHKISNRIYEQIPETDGNKIDTFKADGLQGDILSFFDVTQEPDILEVPNHIFGASPIVIQIDILDKILKNIVNRNMTVKKLAGKIDILAAFSTRLLISSSSR